VREEVSLRTGIININLKKKSVQLLVTSSILLIFLILFSANLVLQYKNNSRVYYDELKKQNDILIKQFSTTRDILLKSLTTYTYNLAIDDIQFKSIIELFQDRYEDKTALMNKMRGFVGSNKYINSAYIYLPKDDLVLTTDFGMSYRKENFYDTDFLKNFSGNYLKMHNQRKVDIFGKEYNYISIICGVRSKGNELIGIFVANINSTEVYREVKNSLLLSERFNIYAFDNNGQILYSNNEQLINRVLKEDERKSASLFSNDKLMTSYYSTDNMDYILDMEFKGFSSKKILEYTFVSFIITLCLALVMKLILSQKVFKPLGKVIANIKGSYALEEKGSSEITVIENAFSDLIDKNAELGKQYTQMLPVYKEKLLHDIVVRKDYTIEEIKNKLSYYKIEIELNNYVIVTLKINKKDLIEEKNRIAKILIRNRIEELMAEKFKGFCVETGKDDISICLSLDNNSFDDVDYDSIVQFAENIVSAMKSDLSISVSTGIGSFVESIEDIYKSYEESIEALNYNKMLRKAIGSIYEIKKLNRNMFEYPYDLEYKLLCFIKVGDYTESYLYLDRIFEKIQKQGMLTDLEIESLIFLLLGALNELIYQNGINTPDESVGIIKMLQVIRNNDLDEVKEEFKNYITKIIDTINVIKGNSKNVVKQILQYIDENYTRELQLIDLEDKFNMNKYYVGQLIKENTGINFNDYINKKRLERSLALLTNSDLAIKAIAEEVGYKYAHYYTKLFKKAYGVAPGEYRNK
jgi:two-component system, response regulator YesN